MPNARLHAFDNARAVMMWLGIVLHVAVNHLTFPTPIPWKDPATSPLADLLFLFIHSFRMPAFFLLSGFMAALLADTRGPGGMLKNRVRRLALPFVMFWPLLLVGMGMLAMTYAQFMHPGLAPQLDRLPIGPMHMWFIYYLMMFSLLAAGAARLPAALRQGWQRVWGTLAGHWWAIPALALPLGLAGAFMPAGMVATNPNFIPQPGALLFYGVFFTLGWTMYGQRAQFAARAGRYYGYYLGAGLAAFVAVLGLLAKHKLDGGMASFIAYANGITALLLSIGIIGLFVRHLPHQHRVLRYVADSSYWVFLVHMLGTMGFGVLLFHAPLAAPLKMAINIVATTAACLLSYHFLVRSTWIGVLLNGRRQSAPKAGTVRFADT